MERKQRTASIGDGVLFNSPLVSGRPCWVLGRVASVNLIGHVLSAEIATPEGPREYPVVGKRYVTAPETFRAALWSIVEAAPVWESVTDACAWLEPQRAREVAA